MLKVGQQVDKVEIYAFMHYTEKYNSNDFKERFSQSLIWYFNSFVEIVQMKLKRPILKSVEILLNLKFYLSSLS